MHDDVFQVDSSTSQLGNHGSGDVDHDYSVGVPEAQMHDPDVLPHMYSDDDADELFPRAVVDAGNDDGFMDFDPEQTRVGSRYSGDYLERRAGR